MKLQKILIGSLSWANIGIILLAIVHYLTLSCVAVYTIQDKVKYI